MLAADSAATDDSCVIYVRKCVRLPKGDVAGGAGELKEVTAILSYLTQGAVGDVPEFGNTSVIFTDAGQPFLACGGLPGVPIKGYCAIGSGAQGAMVAMKLGLSAEDAVRAVSGVDHCTGGEIEVLAVQPPKARRGRPARKA